MERLTALFRLSGEYIGDCGPNTKSFLAVLLIKLETDARFVRLDVAGALEDLKRQCI